MATINVSVQVTADSAEEAEALLYNALVDSKIDAVVGVGEEV